MNLKRTGSLGSLNFELEIVQQSSESTNITKSASENDISFLLAVSTPTAKHGAMRRCPSSCASLDAIDEDEQPAANGKRELIRLHIATPPRLLLVVIVLLLNLTVGVTAAAASFLAPGGRSTNAAPSTKSKAHSPTIKAVGACRTSRRGSAPNECPPRAPTPKLQFPQGAFLERYGAPPTLPLPDLKKSAAELKKSAAELARAAQERASSDLNKLFVQLGPAGESDPAHHAVPATPVAWVGFFATAAAVLTTPEQRLTTLSEAEAQRQALEEAARLVEASAAAAAVAAPLPPARSPRWPPASARTARASTSSSSSASSSTDHLSEGSALPAGFDLDVAIQTGELCGFCYHSCDPKDKQGNPTHRERLRADLAAGGHELIAEVESDKFDTYALLVRRGDEVFVTFRGSATLKNLQVDLNYQPAKDKTMAAFAAEAGLELPAGISVHGGFLDAWRSVREEVMGHIEQIVHEENARPEGSRSLRLVVGGHSMGGAMAMFASLELAARLRRLESGQNPFALGHVTYTFAAPRLGNEKFAMLYDRMFPKKSDHWALQRSNDAVPHLPFHAWGFRHPRGVAFLELKDHDDEGCDPWSEDGCEVIYQSESAPPRGAEKPLKAVKEMGDRGDDYFKLRPFGNKVENWANYHHIMAYLEPLQGLTRQAEYEGYEA